MVSVSLHKDLPEALTRPRAKKRNTQTDPLNEITERSHEDRQKKRLNFRLKRTETLF